MILWTETKLQMNANLGSVSAGCVNKCFRLVPCPQVAKKLIIAALKDREQEENKDRNLHFCQI